MGVAKTGVSSILASFLIVTILISVIGFSVQTLFDSQTYIDILEETDGYAIIEGQLGDQISIDSIPEESVKSVIDRFIITIFDYLNGETQELDLTLNLGDSVTEFFKTQAEEFRVCDPGEEPFGGDDINCRPSDVDIDEFVDDVLQRQEIDPERFASADLSDVFFDGAKLESVRGYVSLYNTAVWVSMFLSAVLIVFIVLLNKDSPKTAARWIGIPFAVSGFLGLGVAYFIKGSVRSFIPEQVLAYADVFVEVVFSVAFGVIDKVILYDGIVFVVGIGFIVFSLLWRPEKKKS